MCRCETGCDTTRCGCKKTHKHCFPTCKCGGNCSNKPLPGCRCEICLQFRGLTHESSQKVNDSSIILEKRMASLERTVHQAIDAVKDMHDSNNTFRVQGLQDTLPGNNSSLVVLPAQPIEATQLMPYEQQSLSSLPSSLSLPMPPQRYDYSGRFTFASIGGVMNFFAQLEQKNFILSNADQHNRLYSFKYPGVDQIVMEVWIQAREDMSTTVNVTARNEVFLNEFLAWLLTLR
jgi:hypothetical protein